MKIISVLALAVVGCVPSYATLVFSGTSIPIPAGLAVGDTFQLVFITTNTTEATSTDINYYNAFVNTDANLGGSLVGGLGITWSVLGSTAAVNVLSNIVNTSPSTPNFSGIFNLAGDLIADGTETTGEGLYSGSIQNLLDVTESGAISTTHVWTGTDTGGSTSNGCGNGASPLGGSISESGYSGDVSSFGTQFWTQSCSIAGPTYPLPLYGISNLLYLGPGDQLDVVPEPATMGTMFLGLAACFLAARRKARRIVAADRPDHSRNAARRPTGKRGLGAGGGRRA